MLLSTKFRILELHSTGRSIPSLVREFGVSRRTVVRALEAWPEVELGARCAEMLAQGVDPYVVADLWRSDLKRRGSGRSDVKPSKELGVLNFSKDAKPKHQ